MNKIILVICMSMWSLFIYAQQKTEYCILRIVNTLKTSGIESKLSIDIGNSKEHSLYNIVENNKNGFVIFKQADGSTITIKDEVDFLAIIEKYGFRLVQVYTTSILEKSYINYLFEKKIP
ncbi:MAG: hypothetical protein N2449_06715 [Bacteroidales bacterium]|nr:hypothetical protein [Bacteroidales bacterium]